MTLTFKGPNYSRSRSGWTPDVLKSGLQKYVRRGDWRAAGRCAWEMLEFSANAVTAAERTTGRALRTNLLNRVLICAAEDVGAGDPVRMAQAMRLVLTLLEHPRSDARAELTELLAALRLLAEARKVRSVSVLRSLLVTIPAQFPDLAEFPVERAIAAGLTAEEALALRAGLAPEAAGPVVPASALANRPEDARALDDAALAVLCDAVPDEIAQQALVVYTHLLAGRWAVIPAALRLLASGPQAKAVRFRPAAPIFWTILREVASATSPAEAKPALLAILDVLQAAHGRTREADVYVITALELFLVYGPAEWQDAIAAAPASAPSKRGEADAIATCAAKLELDSFVLDMHTRVGRATGRSVLDFALEGSLVIPERVIVPRPIAKALYTARKLFEEAGRTPEGVAAMRATVARLAMLGPDDQRQVGALLDLLTAMTPAVPAPPSGRPRPRAGARRAAPSTTTHPGADVPPGPLLEITKSDFEVLASMVGCIGGRKPLLQKVRMHADGGVWLLKPVKGTFYLWVDRQKARYGLEPIGMDLVRLDGSLAVRMRFVESAVNLSRMSHDGGRAWYTDPAVRRQYLRIALFRVGLHVSDTSPYNTLAYRGADGLLRLVSIDEMATTVRHDTPRILGGPRATATIRDADLAWARALVRDWQAGIGEPALDYTYLRAVFGILLGWAL